MATRRRDLLIQERKLWRQGLSLIAGVDEVGLGPLAGPVIAAAVILPTRVRIKGAADSKVLTPPVRVTLDKAIREKAISIGIGTATLEEIERINIYHAGLLAMRRACQALDPPPEMVLSDARTIPDLPWPQQATIKGDALIHCIACASIVAKVHRDDLMRSYDVTWPEYGFARHKGYATSEHIEALERLGPSPIHRKNFRRIAEQLEQLELFADGA